MSSLPFFEEAGTVEEERDVWRRGMRGELLGCVVSYLSLSSHPAILSSYLTLLRVRECAYVCESEKAKLGVSEQTDEGIDDYVVRAGPLFTYGVREQATEVSQAKNMDVDGSAERHIGGLRRSLLYFGPREKGPMYLVTGYLPSWQAAGCVRDAWWVACTTGVGG